MRRETSIDPDWFEQLYAEQGDPWDFESSPYERAKYDHTLAALPSRHFDRALEVGCANGVLTERLAPRCDRLIAVDVSDTALAAARARLAGRNNVELARMRLPAEVPGGSFDLVLLSEVAYYWDGGDLARAGRWLARAVRANGHLMLVHWTGETDYPRTGDEAVAELLAALEAEQRVVERAVTDRRERYRLDLWRL
jgi:SAM-dependent methyltransferase